MSAPKKTYSSTTSAKSKHSVRVAQTTADAALEAVYEMSGDSGDSFDYSKSVGQSAESVPAGAVTAYLQRMQRGGLIQNFGCMVAVEEPNFCVIAYSENASEFLDLILQAVPSMGEMDVLGIGTDIRTLFTPSSSAALEKAAATQDISLLNPITVHCRRSGKPLYAIAHRIDIGIVIDFEAVKMIDVPVSAAAGALQSHKLAARAITRLQALPGGDIELLCDTIVEEVRELTGYDRVMAFKFHEDEHGEVVAEIRRMDLEPYMGLHYPATDIPQASRFLLMKNRVRLIADCYASPVKLIQDPDIRQPVSLAGSTLRAPHGCHAQYMGNMGSIASLVMAVIINDNEEYSRGAIQRGRKLWGLVVCQHTSPRTVPFPLRSVCEFLMQVFGMQLNLHVELAAQLREKHILRTQTLLCDMLLRDAPIGIVSQTPNIMDLVKCDGAALYYGKRVWLLGTTPTENQIKEIADWLLEHHNDSTGLSTDSLADANYPGAHLLGDAVCGMAAAKITAKDFLFWFRSHTATEVKWGGAKHDPDEKDDGRKMHPRSSFKAFLEVVNKRSPPWEDVEMDAIHSLQLILRGSFRDIADSDTKTMIHARLNDLKLQGVEERNALANEMSRVLETAAAPILAVDSRGMINAWNAKIAQVTGLPVEEAMHCSLTKDLVLDESVVVVERLLSLALQGEEEQNVEIKLKTFGTQTTERAVILIVNACCSRDASDFVVGVFFVGQDVTEQRMFMDRFTRIQGGEKTTVQDPHPLMRPSFDGDEFGRTFKRNSALGGLKDHATGSVERLDLYLRRAEECMEVMETIPSPKFNNKQCQYLAGKLKAVLQSASLFLRISHHEHHELGASIDMGRHVEIFKLLLALAKEIESFIQGCCKDEWIKAAMTLTNVSEYVSSMGFNLELCKIAFCKSCAASGSLTLDQIEVICKDEAEVVKRNASIDVDTLFAKVIYDLTEKTLSSDQNDLAIYLLQRLKRAKPILPSFSSRPSWWNFYDDWSFSEKFFQWIQITGSLGSGSSATVEKAVWLGTPVAKKTFYGRNNEDFKREVEILAELCHPNITSMFCSPLYRRKCSIIMELMDGDLLALMQRRLDRNEDHDSPPFSILEVVDIILQTGEGMNYLHEKGIIHRDLKSMNILVKSVKVTKSEIGYVHVKVADFGLSKTKDSSTRYSNQTWNRGTNRWMAPEVINLGYESTEGEISFDGKVPKYPLKSDVYSFGMVCYEVLTGDVPFPEEKNPNNVKRMVLEGVRPDLPAHCPIELKALITDCWNQDPLKRPSFAVICQKLKYLKYLLMTGFSSYQDSYPSTEEPS
ncbi:hypothetical protein M758_8G161200 [Ceratodon purpureus]|nr:hypothetical protein M758_8G161200 [Ceratodon purpureus]